MSRRSKKAVILFSGGLDSTTILYYAKDKGYQPYCLIFDYGQRHHKEIGHAQRLARKLAAGQKTVKITLPWQGSSLLDKSMAIPKRKKIDPKKIPSTYVPARNIIFLSFGVSYAEAIGARHVFLGANVIDYSGYPDCRPAFINAYQTAVRRGMKSGVENKAIRIHTPLIKKTKAQIIHLGIKLGVPYDKTWSCYTGKARPCGTCESCRLREKGFRKMGIKDPL